MSHAILIVGASRGIGAELARQFSTLPDYNIITTVRSSILPESSTNIRFIKLDQNSAESVAAASKDVNSVDILVLNAAIGDEEYMETTSDERLQEYLVSNVVGPHRVIKEFLPALMRGSLKKIILVSSTSGSLANQVKGHQGFAGPYSVSKAAGNMLVVQYQNELRQKGFYVAAMHPGWVATDMGKLAGDGGMPVTESAAGLKKLILGLRQETGARFYNYDGTTIPW